VYGKKIHSKKNEWRRMATLYNLRLHYGYMLTSEQKITLFMGSDLASQAVEF
jgi:1,4-alpha-glucan branching enzyme